MARKKIAMIGSGMIGGTLAHIAAREELGEHIASASVTNIDDEQATKTAQTPSASTGFPSV